MHFHETVYGKRFFEKQLPDLIRALTRLAVALEKQNEFEVREETVNNEK